MKDYEIHLGCFYKHNGRICYVVSYRNNIKIIYIDNDKFNYVSARELEPLELDVEYLDTLIDIDDYQYVRVTRITKDSNSKVKFLFEHLTKDMYIDYMCYMKYMHEYQLHVLLSCGVSLTESLISFYQSKSNNENNQ